MEIKVKKQEHGVVKSAYVDDELLVGLMISNELLHTLFDNLPERLKITIEEDK